MPGIPMPSPCPLLININFIAAPDARINPMSGNPDPQMPATFKLVAKIGVSVAAISCLGLVLVLLLLRDDDAASYAEVIGAYGQAQRNLGPAMAIFGLTATAFAGLSTWLFSLYASFRIAGPLYRIARNLERQIRHGPIATVPIRAGDALQDEWKAFDASVSALRIQYGNLKLAKLALDHPLESSAAGTDPTSPERVIAHLVEVERRVRL